jgi:hypothetical protein
MFDEQFLPQRFRWRSTGYVRWKYGVTVFNHTMQIWEIHTFGLHRVGFWDALSRRPDLGPTPVISDLIGPVSAFQWIDSHFGWKFVEPTLRP